MLPEQPSRRSALVTMVQVGILGLGGFGLRSFPVVCTLTASGNSQLCLSTWEAARPGRVSRSIHSSGHILSYTRQLHLTARRLSQPVQEKPS
jgi:hypothetical protein